VSYQNILFAVEAGVARLTLNRPERLNSFNTAMHAEVRAALATQRHLRDQRLEPARRARGAVFAEARFASTDGSRV